MTQYFVRYSDSRQWLQDDLQRGYSFRAYQFASSPEELCEEFGYDIEDDGSLFDIQEHSNGQYGFALAGLCGYGPFESVEQAELEARNGSYGVYSVCGIYEGRSVGLDDDSLAELFRPTALVKVID